MVRQDRAASSQQLPGDIVEEERWLSSCWYQSASLGLELLVSCEVWFMLFGPNTGTRNNLHSLTEANICSVLFLSICVNHGKHILGCSLKEHTNRGQIIIRRRRRNLEEVLICVVDLFARNWQQKPSIQKSQRWMESFLFCTEQSYSSPQICNRLSNTGFSSACGL